MPDAKTESRSLLERYIPMVGAIMALSPLLVLFFQNPFIFFAVNVIAVIAFMVVVASWNSRVLTERSPILGGDGNPLDLRFFRDRKRKWGFVLAVVGVFVFAWLYFFRFDLIAPASITTFTGSRIIFNDQAENPSFRSKIYPARDYFVATDKEDVFLEIMCHAAVKIVVSRNQQYQGKSVRIEAVNFDVKHIVHTGWWQRRGVGPQKVEPTRFKVSVAHDTTKATAIMLDQKGNATGDTLVLNDDHEFAVMHFQFDGKTGLYRITPHVTIMDGRNRHVITHSLSLYVGVLEPNWDHAADKTNVRVHRDRDDRTEALMVFRDGREREVKLRKVELPETEQ